MGGGASSQDLTPASKNTSDKVPVKGSSNKLDNGERPVTPRGISAEDAVKRLRAMPNNFNHRMLLSIAKPKFVELDVDKKGLLEVKDLVQVAASALPLYKPGGMKAADEEDTRTLIEFEETLRINNEPTTLEDLCAMLEYTSARVALRSASFRKFRELDTDNSGYLDRNELTEVVDWVLEQFSSLGLSNADEEMIRVNFINKVDSNTDGKLDEEEFAEMFEEVAMSAHLMRNARAKFTELDTDGSDSLEGPELEILCDWVVHIYYPRGVRVTDYERDLIKAKIMKNIDTNGDGCLDIQEFASLFEEITMRIELNKRAMKKFIELDKDNTGKLDVEKLEKLADWVLKLCAPTVDKVAIRRNFLHKLQSTPDMKLDIFEFTTLYMQFLKILDVRRRGSLRFMHADVQKKGIFDFDEIPPVVTDVLVALSLLPSQQKEALDMCKQELERQQTSEHNAITFDQVVKVVEMKVLGIIDDSGNGLGPNE